MLHKQVDSPSYGRTSGGGPKSEEGETQTVEASYVLGSEQSFPLVASQCLLDGTCLRFAKPDAHHCRADCTYQNIVVGRAERQYVNEQHQSKKSHSRIPVLLRQVGDVGKCFAKQGFHSVVPFQTNRVGSRVGGDASTRNNYHSTCLAPSIGFGGRS